MSKLKWGFSTLGAPEMTMEELVTLAKKHDIHYIEVRTAENRTDIPALFNERYEDPNILKKLLAENNVKIIGLNSGFKLLNNNKESQDELLAFGRWCEILNVPYIRIFGGLDFGTLVTNEHYIYANQTLEWWSREKEKNGWKTELLLETHDVFSDSEGILRLLENLDYPLNLIWDSHHTYRSAGEDFTYSWEKLKKYTKHIHVKDSIDKPSAKHDHTYTLPGEGDIDVKVLLNMLETEDFKGIVSLEWELAWHPYLQTLDCSLLKAKEVGWISDKL